MRKPRILVFASGSATGGGSGFENLVKQAHEQVLDAHIAAVVSNHEHGGVRQRADKLKVPFIHFPRPWSWDAYRRIAEDSGADFFALSGWLKLVLGLDPALTFNIHPGPLPDFGGEGMYGHHVHEAVMEAYGRGEISFSAVCMHFVTAEYDRGPIFFRYKVKIEDGDTPDTIGNRVNQCEHRWQPEITNLVVHREITWDGDDPKSLRTPDGYKIVRSDS
jgi:phosphoribosylglycinamide formyltransferase-1